MKTSYICTSDFLRLLRLVRGKLIICMYVLCTDLEWLLELSWWVLCTWSDSDDLSVN